MQTTKLLQHIVVWSGLILILAGLVLVIVQFRQANKPAIQFEQRSFDLEVTDRDAQRRINGTGLILIIVGAGLEIAGFMGAKSAEQKRDGVN
jgi:uncharacterized membrane protein